MHIIWKFVVFFYFFVFLVPTDGIDMTASYQHRYRNIEELKRLNIVVCFPFLICFENVGVIKQGLVMMNNFEWSYYSVDDSSLCCATKLCGPLTCSPFRSVRRKSKVSYYCSKSAQVFLPWWKTPNHNIRSKWDSTFFTWSPLWMLRRRSLSTWRLRVRERKSGQNNKLQATE